MSERRDVQPSERPGARRGARPGARARFLLAYTVAFALLALVVFSPFIITGSSFVWQIDGLTQHVKALSFYGEYLREVVSALASGATPPTFSFALGYGQDVVGSLSYYVVGDPLNLLSALVPTESTPILYTALVVVRFYLAGLALSLFARYALAAPPAGCLSGALTYAFCGFALFAGVRHPYFLDPLVCLPLVLYGVEKVLRERRHVPFILAIALTAAANFYFFYMVFLVMALYIVMRLVALHRPAGPNPGVRRATADFARLVGAGLIGLAIACAVFAPTVLFFLQDTRAAVEYAVPLLYSEKFYSLVLLNVSTTSGPGMWTYLTVGVFAVIAIVSLFSERHANIQLKVALAVTFALLLVPFAGHVFNGFSYAVNRWSWAFSLACACAVAVRWDAVTAMTRRQALGMGAAVGVYLVVSAALGWTRMPHAGMIVAMGLWALSVAAVAICAVRNGRLGTCRARALSQGMAVVVVCAGIALNALALYGPFGGDYGSRFLAWDEVSDIYETEADDVAKLAAGEGAGAQVEGAAAQGEGAGATAGKPAARGEGAGSTAGKPAAQGEGAGAAGGFYRYTGPRSVVTRNAAAVEGVSSTSSYWSLAPSHTKQFFSEMGIIGSDSGGCCWYNVDGMSQLAELVGVRYYVAEPGDLTLYGYSGEPAVEGGYYEPFANEDKEFAVFENEAPLPFGFTYASAISADQFAALEPRERREAVLQSCVVGERSGGTTLGSAASGGEAADGTASDGAASGGAASSGTSSSGAASSGAAAGSASSGAQVPEISTAELDFTSKVVPFTMKAGKGVEVEEGLFTVTKRGAQVVLDVDASAPKRGEASIQFTDLVLDPAIEAIDIEATFEFEDGSSHSCPIAIATQLKNTFEPYHWITESPGFATSRLARVILTFPNKGTYAYGAIDLIVQPMKAYDGRVAALAEDVLEDVDMHYAGVGATLATSRVTGRISLDEPKVLCTQIPYSEGWSVRVDGKPAELLQLDVLLAGVALAPGEHTVEFAYETPGLRAGALLTLAGIALLAVVACLERRRAR